MKWIVQVASAVLLVVVVSCQRHPAGPIGRTTHSGEVRVFQVNGVITEIGPGSNRVVVNHEAVADYMPAMTMPFHLTQPGQISGLRPGDAIRFQLHVSKDESWIDDVTSTLSASSAPIPVSHPARPTNAPSLNLKDIPDFALTNELGHRVSLRQFQGQAVALTFFFTRCPIPEYCPRLSRSFADASQQLNSRPNAPTNWHLLSISFDPLDRPEVLRAYAEHYRYDSNHWTFLTGDPAHLRALTHGFGLSATPEEGIFTHDFRTAVFDANGQLQTLWPFGGDTTQLLVQELTKGAAVIRNARTAAGKQLPDG
jgi:protein SCO1/2